MNNDNPLLARYGSWPAVLGLLVAAVVISSLVSFPVILAFSGTNILANPWALFVLIAIEDTVFFALVYFFLIRRGITSWTDMGFSRPPTLRSLWQGALYGCLFVLSTSAIDQVLRWLGVEQTQAGQFPIQDATGGGLIAIWVAGVVFAPLTEEIFFRGYVYRAMSLRKGPARGLAYSSILFGLVHFNLAAFIPITVGALILAEGYRRSGDLWVPVIAHGLNNIVAFTLLALAAG